MGRQALCEFFINSIGFLPAFWSMTDLYVERTDQELSNGVRTSWCEYFSQNGLVNISVGPVLFINMCVQTPCFMCFCHEFDDTYSAVGLEHDLFGLLLYT